MRTASSGKPLTDKQLNRLARDFNAIQRYGVITAHFDMDSDTFVDLLATIRDLKAKLEIERKRD